MIRAGSLVYVSIWSDDLEKHIFPKDRVAIMLEVLDKPNMYSYDYKILFCERIMRVYKHEIKEV